MHEFLDGIDGIKKAPLVIAEEIEKRHGHDDSLYTSRPQPDCA